jgi:diguanylate cyclase (GGDEF)-like protein
MRRFVSLPFKIMSLIIAFLLIASISMTYLWINKTDNDYLSQQQLMREQDQKQFQLIQDMLRSRIESWFESFVHFQHDSTDTVNAIALFLQEESEYFKISWQINNLWLTGRQGEVFFTTTDAVPDFVKSDANMVLEQQTSLSFVRCSRECQQFISMPILIDSSQVIVLTISSSLMEAMAALHQTTSADMAIVRSSLGEQASDKVRNLVVNPPISNANKQFMQQVLKQVPANLAMNVLLTSGYRLNTNSNDLLLNLIPIDENMQNNLYLLTVHDISAVSKAHRAYRAKVILISILVVALCATAIWILSMQFRQRLLAVTRMLPLLAQKKYVEFRQYKQVNSHYFSDEIEILQDTTCLLGEELEKLDRTIADNTKALETIALYDSLTGLPNRNMLNQQLAKLLDELSIEPAKLVLLFIDFDKFRKVNDSYGHQIGDQFLIQGAKHIQQCLQKTDLLFCLGGDEFVIVFKDNDNQSRLHSLPKQLIQHFLKPIVVGERQFYSSCSIGVTSTETQSMSVDELTRQADIAMKASKDAGNSKITPFNSRMLKDVLRKAEIENELRVALSNEELSFALQAQIDIKSKKLLGFEALIRWHHPSKGRIAPDEFIPVIENSESMINLGYWGLKRAFIILEQLDAIAMPGLKVAVNLSASQFLDPLLIPFLKQQLITYSRDASQIELELTEQTVVADIQQTLDTMHALRELGFTFSIDDFGTGYSSLSYLRQMPVEYIKIDRSFVSKMHNNNAEMKIVSSTIAMVNKLGMQVIAEGIETEAQLEILNIMGCDIGQGYFISKPIDESEIYALLPSKVKNGIWLTSEDTAN